MTVDASSEDEKIELGRKMASRKTVSTRVASSSEDNNAESENEGEPLRPVLILTASERLINQSCSQTKVSLFSSCRRRSTSKATRNSRG